MTGPGSRRGRLAALPGVQGLAHLVQDFLRLDRRALVILVSAPVLLTLLEYVGLPWQYTRWHYRTPQVTADPPPYGYQPIPGVDWLLGLQMPGPRGLQSYIWWGASCVVLFILLPMAIGALVRVSPRELGLRLRGTWKESWTYLLLFLLFVPVVWLVSHRPDFQKTYPFYKPPGGVIGWDFLAFEAIYCLQFLAIEFFFRGFLVLGLKPRLGMASVLVMIAPYCMIHYYKPMPEALGAIGAGVVLGLLSWRTGTVVYGWFLHYAVALSMDLLALRQTGVL